VLLEDVAEVEYGYAPRFGGKFCNPLKITKFLLIFSHIQLLSAFVLLYLKLSALNTTMGAIMKNADLRKLFVEHPTGMVLAIILITVGHLKLKKDVSKNSLILFIISFLIMGYLIPWAKIHF
ncbi:MAG: hypothetical protein QM539_08880, partial [Alphaproteobacteria bacterium]|nr:hypothetical protein [Alphaproteobacteria bacterium]